MSAYCITVTLSLPNHFTSLFVGYFGIDVFDAIASRFELKGFEFARHEPRPTQNASSYRAVDERPSKP